MNEFKKDANLEKCDPHTCCNVCTKSCSCPSCISEPSAGIVEIKSANCAATLSEDQQKQLCISLISFKQEWYKSANTSHLLIGEEICTGLSDEAIEYIFNNLHDIDTKQKLFDLWDEHSKAF